MWSIGLGGGDECLDDKKSRDAGVSAEPYSIYSVTYTKSKIPAFCQRYCIVEISMLSNEVLIHVLSFKRIVQGNRCLTILQLMCTAVDSCTLNQTTGQWICFYQY